MFIIFGTRVLTYKKGEGEFQCPQCRSLQPYRHMRTRQFFSLFFVPVLPLWLRREFIQCRMCGQSFKMKVLSPQFQSTLKPVQDSPTADPSGKDRESLNDILLKIIISRQDAGAQKDEKRIKGICDLFYELTGEGVSFNRVLGIVDSARNMDWRKILPQYTSRRGDLDKELVLKTLYRAVLLDGQSVEAGQEVLRKTAVALGMTPAHIQGILNSL